MVRKFGPLALVILVVAAGWWSITRSPAAEQPPVLVNGGQQAPAEGFARALEPGAFEFPRDHGPHLDYQTEWWYYTGNLTTQDGRRAAYQLTFFRRGLAPGEPERTSELAATQVYFAHFALIDAAANVHSAAERFSRGAGGLAGASGAPFEVWLDDWRAEALNTDGSRVRITARHDDMALDLVLEASKPIVAHGMGGLSPKSETPGNASYYLSYTRMATSGTITLGGQTAPVTGQSWCDPEWSTSALGPGAIGWDWFSLQLDDGREVMFFQIRREDGSLEPASSGTLIEVDGSTRRLTADEVEVEVLAEWRSPDTGGQYPSRWRVSIPSAQITLDIVPLIAAQEMQVSFVYWEGAVTITGSSQGQPVLGVGFVEMTGYVSSIAGQF